MEKRFEFIWEADTPTGKCSGNVVAYGRTEEEARVKARTKIWNERFKTEINPVRIVGIW